MQFPDIFGTRKRAARLEAGRIAAVAQKAAELANERTVLGERLFTALKKAISERSPDLHFGVRVGKMSQNGGCFSVVYGFNEADGREIAWHEGGGQFDIKLNDFPYLGGEKGPFRSHPGKYMDEIFYDDFETFLKETCELLRTVK